MVSDAADATRRHSGAEAANALIEAGRYEDAAGVYRRMLLHQPDDADVLAALAAVDVIGGRPDAASQGALRALAVAPEDPNVLQNALFVAMRLSPADPLHRQRASIVDALLQVDPYGEVSGPRAVSGLVDVGRLSAAVELADELVERRPDDPIVRRAAGWAHLSAAARGSGRRARQHRRLAKDHLRAALRVRPDDAVALAMLSDVATSSGRRVEGVELAVSAVQAGSLQVESVAAARIRRATIVAVALVVVVTAVAALAATMSVSSGVLPPTIGALVVWASAAAAMAYEHRAHRRLVAAVPAWSRPEADRTRAWSVLVASSVVVVAAVFFLAQSADIWIVETDGDRTDRCVVGTSMLPNITSPSLPAFPPLDGSPGLGPGSTVRSPTLPTTTRPEVALPVMGPCPGDVPDADDVRRADRIEALEHLTAPAALVAAVVAGAWSVRSLLRVSRAGNRTGV